MGTRKACRFFAVWLLVMLLAAWFPAGVQAAGVYDELPEVDIQAKAAILVYAHTGEILYSHNIHIRREPASITKLLTCLIAVEKGNLDDIVTAQEGDFFDLTSDGSTIGLRPGDSLTLRDLLYCALLSSANESCNIIARHIGGDIPTFIGMMNERMAELGCENSNFTNTHGLPADEHYSTAYDISLLAAACVNNKTITDITKTTVHVIPPTSAHSEGYQLTTTNRMLIDRSNDSNNYYYEPTQGLKTGSTNNAGLCLASFAKRKGDDSVLISVVLGASREEGEDGVSIQRHFTETRALFEWGFSNFSMKTLVSRNAVIDDTAVLLGLDKDVVYLVAETALEKLVPSALVPEDITLTVTKLYPQGVTAPIVRGAPMGTVSVSYQGREYGVVNLVAAESIHKDSGEEVVQNVENFLEQPWLRTALLGTIILVAMYIILVIVLNAMKKRKRRPTGNYRGKKRR